MGAVFYSLDVRLIERLRGALPLKVFLETGSFHGDGIAAALDRFEKIYSVELSAELYLEVSKRFAGRPAVTVMQEDSITVLERLQSQLRSEPVFYWLDAHWSAAEHAANQNSQCPVLRELEAIGTLNGQSVIAIDDARLFLCPPKPPHQASQWPHFDDLTAALHRLSPEHRMMVVNDVILFYPIQVEPVLDAYAVEYGLDWNQALQACTGGIDALFEIETKEKTMQHQHSLLTELHAALLQKEQLITALDAQLRAAAERAASLEATAAERLDATLQKEQAITALDAQLRAAAERATSLEATAAERLEATLQKEQLIAALEAERSSLSARLAAAERGLLLRVALSVAHRVRALAGERERRQRPAAR